MEYRRTSVINDYAPAADGYFDFDLPPGAISHVDFMIKALNVTDEATAAEILAMVSKIEILYNGESIESFSAADLAALNAVMFGKQPVLTNLVATDNATRQMGLCIPFGRVLYDPAECFPAHKAGTLKIGVTVDIANAGADGLILIAEAIELPKAVPESFLKITTMSKTPAATGDCDVDLPTGNLVAGILCWGTTAPTTTAWTATIDKLKLLADNAEKYVANTYWETLHKVFCDKAGTLIAWGIAASDDDFINYGFVDFSPYGINDYLLDTSPFQKVSVRVVAGDTNPLRILPLEVVKVATREF